MDENNKSLNNFINDLPEFIKFLFESGINDSVENCRKNPIHLYPYSTPCPSYHGSLNDWRGTKDFIFEDVCKSRIRLAFDRAYPIKSRIPFYDSAFGDVGNLRIFSYAHKSVVYNSLYLNFSSHEVMELHNSCG